MLAYCTVYSLLYQLTYASRLCKFDVLLLLGSKNKITATVYGAIYRAYDIVLSIIFMLLYLHSMVHIDMYCACIILYIYTMHLSCVKPVHAYTMHVSCTVHTYTVLLTCTRHAYTVHLTCTMYAYTVQFTCTMHAYTVQLTCTMHAYTVHLTCTVHAYTMQSQVCTMHVTCMVHETCMIKSYRHNMHTACIYL